MPKGVKGWSREACFMNLVEKHESGCWLWKGCIMRDGYGKFTVSKKESHLAYRYSWRLFRGEPPVWPMQLDHLCRVRACVNPDHLEVVTQKENHRRHRKPFCKWGHAMTDENRYWYSANGKLVHRCKACIPNQRRKA